jgi:hypothetical protein
MTQPRTTCLVFGLLLACSSPAPEIFHGSAEMLSNELDAGTVLLPQPDDDEAPRCSLAAIDTQRVVPTVYFVVDGSGSMLEPLSASEATTRWDALRDALLNEQSGVVKTLQDKARFGLLAYGGPLADADVMTPAGSTLECPRLVSVDPALDNFEAISEAFTLEPLGGSTPTDKALDTIIERLDLASTGDTTGPSIVILATDGQPNDFCAGTPAADIREKVIADARHIAEAGHSFYVISLAGEDGELTQHLNAVAGVTGTGKPAFKPQRSAELVDTIRALIAPSAEADVLCEVQLVDTILPGKACELTVELNGEALACDEPNGWRLRNEGGASQIEITGDACDTYMQDVQARIHVEYTCDIIE